MSLVSRLKLWGGIVLILAFMFLLTLLFNQRQVSVASTDASVQAPFSTVGSAYGGVVVEQAVHDGDKVTKGQKLFVVSSSSLQQDIARGAKPQSNIAYDIDAVKGDVTYKAVADGYVSDLKGFQGGFVNDGAPLATVVASGKRTVKATYRLAPADYGRITQGAEATIFMPNNVKVKGTVTGVSVRVDEKQETLTDVTISADELDDAHLGVMANRGTPVNTTMKLRDDGVLAGPTQALLDFLTKIGLR